jgi:hypothetical protein
MTTEDNCFDVIELNVGGVTYATTFNTLQQADPDSPLASITSSEIRTNFGRDSKNRIFIDRDGTLFRYVLDYLRNKKLSLPENFSERDRLRMEADYYRLTGLSQALRQTRPYLSSNGKHSYENMIHLTRATNAMELSPSLSGSRPPPPRSHTGYIVIGYRGTFGKSKTKKTNIFDE